MTPLTFPERESFGWVSMVFIKQMFIPGNFRWHSTLYLATLGFYMSHLSITVMKTETVLVMGLHSPLLHPRFRWSVFLGTPSLLGPSIRNPEAPCDGAGVWAGSIHPGPGCRTLTQNDTVLDYMSGLWLRLSSPHQMAPPWSVFLLLSLLLIQLLFLIQFHSVFVDL